MRPIGDARVAGTSPRPHAPLHRRRSRACCASPRRSAAPRSADPPAVRPAWPPPPSACARSAELGRGPAAGLH
eukprot:366355-Chlamydomonas_euryale.AAC.12